MHRITLAAALLCASVTAYAEPMDPRCNGSARYQAMSDADFAGHGTGHACAPQSPANFLAGIRSIDVVMHREHVARSTRYLVFAVHYGAGSVWYNKADAMLLPAGECARLAKDYGDGVDAACYRPKALRALRSTPPTAAEMRLK